MFHWIRQSSTWIGYGLIVLYGVGLQLYSTLAPLSFEDHFLFTLFLHFILIALVPYQMKHHKLGKVSLLFYGLSFVSLHLILQMTLSYFFRPVCSISYGLMWYFIFELGTVLVLISLLYYFEKITRYSRLLTLGVILIFFLINLWDLYFEPGLFFMHPTLGYYPGPIYDEWIPVSKAVWLYQGWRILLAVCLLIPLCHFKKIALLIATIPLVFGPFLGFRSSHSTIQQTLPVHTQTKHANIYSLTALSLSQQASIDYWIQTLRTALDITHSSSQKVRIYAFEDSRLKKRLTGSGDTLIGNPIQKTLYLNDLNVDAPIFVHELTHVLASDLNAQFFSMPWNMAVTEGLAMATQETFFYIDNHLWVKALLETGHDISLDTFFSTTKFYRLPSAHAYTLSGSFSNWLIETHGMSRFHKLYQGESLEKAYSIPSNILEQHWLSFIENQVLDPALLTKMNQILSQKSVFEKKCPHEIAHARYKMQNCSKEKCKQDWIEKAFHLNPEDPQLALSYGICLLSNQKRVRAQLHDFPNKDFLKQVFSENPVDEPHIFLAVAQQNKHALQQFYLKKPIALQTLKTLQAHSVFLWHVLQRRAYRPGEQKEILSWIDPADLNPQQRFTYFQKQARILEHLHLYQRASDTLDQALQEQPSAKPWIMMQKSRLKFLTAFFVEKENQPQTK